MVIWTTFHNHIWQGEVGKCNFGPFLSLPRRFCKTPEIAVVQGSRMDKLLLQAGACATPAAMMTTRVTDYHNNKSQIYSVVVLDPHSFFWLLWLLLLSSGSHLQNHAYISPLVKTHFKILKLSFPAMKSRCILTYISDYTVILGLWGLGLYVLILQIYYLVILWLYRPQESWAALTNCPHFFHQGFILPIAGNSQ